MPSSKLAAVMLPCPDCGKHAVPVLIGREVTNMLVQFAGEISNSN